MKPDKITKVYLEDRDCGANPSLPEYNTLKLKTVDNYLVIETARWALDETTVEDFFLEIRSMLKELNQGQF